MKLITNIVGSEVLTAMVMMSSIFWDIILCRPLKVNHYFRGKCHLHQAKQETSMKFENILFA
jgi:hypothetical protein